MFQLSRSLGLHHSLNTEGKLLLITELKAHYHHGLKFGENPDCLKSGFLEVLQDICSYHVSLTGKSALKTELQFSDMYCLMAAHVYVDLWMDTGESLCGVSLCICVFAKSLNVSCVAR